MREDTNLYDFPCSYLYRSYEEFQNTGQELPAIDPPEIPDEQVETAHKRLNRLYSRITRLENSGNMMNAETLLQIKGEVAYLRKKVNEILDRKPKGEFF